jgi:copper resistance protein C
MAASAERVGTTASGAWGAVRLLLAAAILGTVAVVAWSGPALAHTELVGSTPAVEEAVGVSTDRLVMSFTDDLLPAASAVVVRDPEGVDVVSGEPHLAGNVLDVGLDLETPGRHTVSYRVVGDDGHVVVGELSFSVVAEAGAPLAQGDGRAAGAVPAASDTPALAPRSSGWLPWTVAGGALVAALLLLHTTSRRRVHARADDAAGSVSAG